MESGATDFNQLAIDIGRWAAEYAKCAKSKEVLSEYIRSQHD